MNNRLNTAGSWRRPAVTTAALAAGALGVVVLGSITGSAQAGEIRPEITANTLGPTFVLTVPPFTFVPITNFTIPQATLIEIPTETFATVPGSSTTTADTTTTTGDTTTTLETTTSSGASTTTDPASQSSGEPEYSLEIDLAQINCDGTIHVEYTTTADPSPATAASHIVMYNPTSLPAEFHVLETPGNAANGSFVFDELGLTDQTYRLFVIALFDPLNPDGPKVIDQADVALAGGC